MADIIPEILARDYKLLLLSLTTINTKYNELWQLLNKKPPAKVYYETDFKDNRENPIFNATVIEKYGCVLNLGSEDFKDMDIIVGMTKPRNILVHLLSISPYPEAILINMFEDDQKKWVTTTKQYITENLESAFLQKEVQSVYTYLSAFMELSSIIKNLIKQIPLKEQGQMFDIKSYNIALKEYQSYLDTFNKLDTDKSLQLLYTSFVIIRDLYIASGSSFKISCIKDDNGKLALDFDNITIEHTSLMRTLLQSGFKSSNKALYEIKDLIDTGKKVFDETYVTKLQDNIIEKCNISGEISDLVNYMKYYYNSLKAKKVDPGFISFVSFKDTKHFEDEDKIKRLYNYLENCTKHTTSVLKGKSSTAKKIGENKLGEWMNLPTDELLRHIVYASVDETNINNLLEKYNNFINNSVQSREVAKINDNIYIFF